MNSFRHRWLRPRLPAAARRTGHIPSAHPFQPVCRRIACCVLILSALAAGAAETNSPAALPMPPLPDMGVSLLRVLGGLAVVLAVFLGGVWLFRNWQRFVVQRGRSPRLNVLEVRSLGGRHALYVVGYEQERFLIGSSPAGLHLVSHLQTALDDASEETASAPFSFATSLAQMLKGRPPAPGKAGVSP